MAETMHKGRVLSTKVPDPLTEEKRAELERGRWYNTSLDQALAEIDRKEAIIQRALEQLEDSRHFAGGYEHELIETVRDTLRGVRCL